MKQRLYGLCARGQAWQEAFGSSEADWTAFRRRRRSWFGEKGGGEPGVATENLRGMQTIARELGGTHKRARGRRLCGSGKWMSFGSTARRTSSAATKNKHGTEDWCSAKHLMRESKKGNQDPESERSTEGSAPRAKTFGDVLVQPAGQPTEVCSGRGWDGTQKQKRAEGRSKGGFRERERRNLIP